MKRIFMFSAMAAIVAVSAIGCKKSSSSQSYQMSATVTKSGGSASTFSASGATYVTAVDSAGICSVIGTSVSGTTVGSFFTFALFSNTGTGTYLVNDTSSNLAEFYTNATDLPLVHGQITISKVAGETVSGTFSGTLSDSSVITNGTFTAAGRGF